MRDNTKYWRWVQNTIHAGAQPNINAPEYSTLPIPLPPLPEQRKIADILGAWDEAIALTEQLIEAKQRRKKALAQQLLTGRRRFKEFEGQPWRKARLEELLDIQYGKSPKDIRNDDGPFLIYGTGGIVGRTDQTLCEQPAVIIGRKGTINQPRLAQKPFWAIDTTFFGVPKDNVDACWIYHVLGEINLEQYNEASGVPSLSRSTLYNISIHVPEFKEQQKIAEVLQVCDAEIDLLHQKLDVLRRQKKGLMQQLLTGRVRVKAV
jgi:type I restriction enzyme S subunit